MAGRKQPSLYLALVHYPVYNRKGEEIASAITNLDLHDLGRLSCTYDLPACYVVTPVVDQKDLVRRLVEHWEERVGRRLHPDRVQALQRLRLVDDVADAVEDVRRETDCRPWLWASTARSDSGGLPLSEARRRMVETRRPGLLLLGTGWGLSERITRMCDGVLDPIRGAGDYNHLSVRCAAAILVDRFSLLGRRSRQR